MADGPDEVLTSLLEERGWSPRALARRINHVFGAGTVADTAACHWRGSGGIPRPPLPELAAWVLFRELGRPVTAAALWQGRASGSPLVLSADIDRDGPWSRASTLGLLDDGVVAGLLDRRHFLAVSGTTILDLATRYPTGGPGRLAAARDGGSGGDPLLAQIEQSIPLLQYGHALAGQLDDFDRAHATGLDTIAGRDPAEEPAGMDYLTPHHLDSRAGYALTHAGTLAAAAGDHQTGTALLRRGERLLRPGAHALPVDHPAQRRALFKGAWLSVATAGQGHLEQACTTGSLAVTRRERVQSVRGAQVLRLLARRSCRCDRNEHARDSVPTLDAALARQPRPA